MKTIVIVFAVLIIFGIIDQAFAEYYPDLGVKIETIAKNLSIPWSIDFAPDGRIFFSERTGTLHVIDDGVQKQIMTLDVGNGEGGMLGMVLDPNFESNHYIYIYYTYNELLSTKNKLVRYVESNNSLTDEKILLEGIPGASYHDGGRIKFGPDGKLYITTGDAGDPNLSQRLDSIAGKILRINSDGSIPDDNPFSNSAVYSYGHRNPQGIDWDKFGVLIATEHGPSGWRGVAHDEINMIKMGANYGWPDVIGDETKDGLTNPILHSGEDTWAPSGATFYYGNQIPQWNGKYFVASLRGEHLLVIDFDSDYNVISHDKLFLGEYGRLRDVVSGPDGLYVLTSNQDGRGIPSNDDDRILRITSLYDVEKIPKWIKNIFIWYGEGQISEDDVLNAITFLVTTQIIQIDTANQSMEMINQDVMKQNMSFNVNVPVIMPMIDGYFNGNKVFFVHTEISDSTMADMMSKMINFPTLHVPELKSISEDQMARIYVFTNGIPGSAPYGGGPFMYQIDVFDSIPGQSKYSQFRIPYLVTWNDDAKPRILTSESAILEAESDGEIIIKKSALVVNAPIIIWEIQGNYGKIMGKTSMIPKMFESMSGVEGELTFVDENNYVAIFKLHSEKGMDMMKMNP